MSKIINKEKYISSCDDIELEIKRDNQLRYNYSYPSSKNLKGIVFVIPGFGDDTNSSYNKNLREYISDKFCVLAVSVDYHCFYSRPSNGATLLFDSFDRNLIKDNLDKNYIQYSDEESTEALLKKWISLIEIEKEKGSIPDEFKSIITQTIIPKNDEYQNFGLLQAQDHLNVLADLKNMKLSFSKDTPVILMGSSHGGYIANLMAKIAPQEIDTVIDNSSYIKPPLNYIAGKERDFLKPEFKISKNEHIDIHLFTKTKWSAYEDDKNYFSTDRYRIRDISDKEHLEYLFSLNTKKPTYISYHSATDNIASIEDKSEFYKNLKKHNYDATLHIIKDESDVDGSFIKDLIHGLGMSLKELANKELPNALKIKSKKSEKGISIYYKCDTIAYKFSKINDEFTIEIEDFDLQTKEVDDSIEQQVTKTYLDNIDYLKDNDPILFEKISALEVAIDKGYHKQQYELEYKEDGYFDVKELSSGNYLYNSDSKKYAQEVSESIDYKKVDNVFIVTPRFNFSKEVLKYLENTDMNSNNAYGIAPISAYINKVIPENSTMKRLDKFVFFGVGLGLQIESAHKKINADYYLLVEDDLELFRLSLFTTNYKNLSKSSELSFCIFEDAIDAKVIMAEFLENAFMHNHYLKFIHSLHHTDAKMRVMHEVISAQPHQIFPYHAYFNKYLRPLEYLKDGYNFLNIRSDKKILASKEVLLLGAGPSLQKHIDWVKENEGRFTIIALTSTLKTLQKHGIKPDIITHLDPFEKGSLPHVSDLEIDDYYNKSICLFAGQTPKELTKLFKKENIFFYENGTFYKKSYGSLGAPCIGSMSYVLSLVLGVKELYLLGLDLALSDDGATHSSSHAHTSKLDTSNTDEMREVFELKKSVIKVKGNFKDEVLTTANFYISINSIKQNTLLNKQKNQNVYNLSDGAELEDAISKKIDDVNLKNLVKLSSTEKFQLLFKSFSSNSTAMLSKMELISINKMLDHSKTVKKMLKKHKASKHNNIDSYKYALLGLSLDITSDTSKEAEQLNLVNLYYMQYIYPYIFDLLNTKELKDHKKHIKKIDEMLIPKMIDIVELFEHRLELFFEEEVV